MKRLKHWLKNRTPKQLFYLLLELYGLVIFVIVLFFLFGKINIIEVAITLFLLLISLIPIFQGRN